MRRRVRYPLFADINITPLTDVMLVLLVIFMSTTAFILPEKILPLNLPQARGSNPAPETRLLVLSINREGSVYLDGVLTTRTELKRKLAQMQTARVRSLPVLMQVDAAARHQSFVSVLEILSELGFGNISLAVKDRGAAAP